MIRSICDGLIFHISYLLKLNSGKGRFEEHSFLDIAKAEHDLPTQLLHFFRYTSLALCRKAFDIVFQLDPSLNFAPDFILFKHGSVYLFINVVHFFYLDVINPFFFFEMLQLSPFPLSFQSDIFSVLSDDVEGRGVDIMSSDVVARLLGLDH